MTNSCKTCQCLWNSWLSELSTKSQLTSCWCTGHLQQTKTHFHCMGIALDVGQAVGAHAQAHKLKQAGVIILMSREEWAAHSHAHDLFSVVLPSIKHRLSHQAEQQIRRSWPLSNTYINESVCPKQTHALTTESSEIAVLVEQSLFERAVQQQCLMM